MKNKSGMKKNRKLLFAVLTAIMVLSVCAVIPVTAADVSVIRDLPDTPVSPEEEFEVSLAQSGFLLNAGFVTETLPEGFTYAWDSLTGNARVKEHNETTNNLTIKFEGETKVTYNVTAGTAEQIKNAVFSGTYKTFGTGFNLINGTVKGDTTLTLAEPTPTPSPTPSPTPAPTPSPTPTPAPSPTPTPTPTPTQTPTPSPTPAPTPTPTPIPTPNPTPIFGTGSGTYPSISGIHKGTIKPKQTITVYKMYTYPCLETGGHSESVRIYYSESGVIAEGTWTGYGCDWHNITFDVPFTLESGETYYYTLRTGSYPQIIHKQNHTTLDGSLITCSEFIDANGKRYDDWIPAIKFFQTDAYKTLYEGFNSIISDAKGDTTLRLVQSRPTPTPPTPGHELFTVHGQVFDTGGTTPLDSVEVSVKDLNTNHFLTNITSMGGWYSVNLANMANNTNAAHIIEVRATFEGKTDSTSFKRDAVSNSPKRVDLTLEIMPSPTPTLTPSPSPSPSPSPTPTSTPSPTPSPSPTPTVTIDTPSEGFLTNISTIAVNGTISENAIVKAYLNGSCVNESVAVDVANLTFNTTIELDEGQNNITITANTGCDTVNGTLDTIRPAAIGSSPTGTGIPITTTISVTFSEQMNRTSVQNAFSISGPQTLGLFVWTTDNTTFTRSASLSYSTTYTVGITTVAKDFAGNNMASDYGWEFATESAPPTVTIDTPSEGFLTNISTIAVNGTISENATVKAYLNGSCVNENAAVDVTNLTFNTTIELDEGQNNITINANTGCDTVNGTLDTIRPAAIGSSPTGSGIPIITTISVTFSEQMNRTSVQNAFSISGPQTLRLFVWTTDNTAFTRSASLSYSTTYTVGITTVAKDLAGNNMASDYGWEFITASAGGGPGGGGGGGRVAQPTPTPSPSPSPTPTPITSPTPTSVTPTPQVTPTPPAVTPNPGSTPTPPPIPVIRSFIILAIIAAVMSVAVVYTVLRRR